MTTWIDPWFGEAVASAGLVALARVTASDPRGAHVALERVFAGQHREGDVGVIWRASVVGRGHEANALPVGESFVFVARAVPGAYQGFTDSFWAFALSDGDRVHLPIRDPFTRAYVPLDDFAELVRAMRDPSTSPAALLARLCARLAETPVAATQPIEVNDQILALEALAHLGGADHADAAALYLGSPHFQIRWSASRALGTCGGPDAARRLLELLARESAPPVQVALGEALFRLADVGMLDALQAALPKVHAESMPYSRNLMSPIANVMPSARDTLAAVIARLDGAPGDLDALRAAAAAAPR